MARQGVMRAAFFLRLESYSAVGQGALLMLLLAFVRNVGHMEQRLVIVGASLMFGLCHVLGVLPLKDLLHTHTHPALTMLLVSYFVSGLHSGSQWGRRPALLCSHAVCSAALLLPDTATRCGWFWPVLYLR